nr:unnamed protein product [Callosobruchus analis]
MKCINCTGSIQSGPSTTCDGCNLKVHLACVGLDVDDRITRSKSKSIKILCNNCNRSWSDFGDVKNFLASFKISIDDQIAALNAKIEHLAKPDFSKIEEYIVALRKDFDELKTKGATNMSSSEFVEDIIQEISEREIRKKNLMVFGLAESTAASESNGGDRVAVNNLLGSIGFTAEELSTVKVTRLDEEYLLISLVDKYKHIIECKTSGATAWREKDKAWEKIAEEFNCKCANNGRRSAKVLKEKYKNLKKKTKEKYSISKFEVNKTGGGQYVPPLITEIDEAVKCVIGDTPIGGLPNMYHCDVPSDAIGMECQNVSAKDSRDDHTNCDAPETQYVEEIEVPDIILTENVNYIAEDKLAPASASGSNTSRERNGIGQGSSWVTYSPRHMKTPVTSKLKTKLGAGSSCYKRDRKCQDKKYVSLNTQLIEAKLDFVRLQKEKFSEEHNIKMQIHKKN